MRTHSAAAFRCRPASLGVLVVFVLVGLGPQEARGQAQASQTKLEPRGRVSVRDAMLRDSDDAHQTHLVTGDLDIFVPRIGGTGLSILFDGEFRKDLSTHPDPTPEQELYLHQEPDADPTAEDFIGRSERTIGRIRAGTIGDFIRSAYVEYAGIAGELDVRFGRVLMTDLGQTWVDGVVAKADDLGGFGFGVFGGLSPNPLDYALTTDYQTFGAYVGHHGASHTVKLAFNQSMAEGETDRQFVYSSGHAGLFDQLFVSYAATVDLAGQATTFARDDLTGENPLTTDLGPQLTMGFANILWWATPQVSFNLSGTTFRNVPFRVSQPGYWPTDFDRDVLRKMALDDQVDPKQLQSFYQRLYLGDSTAFPAYYSARFSPSVRFGGGFYAYVSLDYRTRDLDDQTGRFISAGLRNHNLFDSKVSARLEYTARNSFLSESNEVFLAVSRKFFGMLDLSLYGTRLDGKSTAKVFTTELLLELRNMGLDPRSAPDRSDVVLDQRQKVWLVGGSLDIDITKRLYLVVDYEYTRETPAAEDAADAEDLTIHSINARLTFRL